MTSATICILCSAAFLGFMVLRRLWLASAVEEYTVKAAYWVWRTKQTEQTRKEMEQMWPVSRIIWDIFHWDLRHYLVYQGHHDEMERYIAVEIERSDIDWSIFKDLEDKEREPAASTEDHDDLAGPN